MTGQCRGSGASMGGRQGGMSRGRQAVCPECGRKVGMRPGRAGRIYPHQPGPPRTELDQAKDLLREMANDRIASTVDRLVTSGAAEWHLDPQVPGTVGVVKTGTNRALVIVYLPGFPTGGPYGDFETSVEFDEMATGRSPRR